ncbi:acetyl-CoA synthetase-like protein, partial [Conidiobolus coronatus NRRL 28638]
MSQIRYSQTGRFIDLIKENTECEANINRSSITINPNGKYINLSFEEFYNIGCNSAKYFYSQLSDIKLSNGRNVGLLSYSDSNYLFNIIGLMNVNAIPLLISPRNSIEAIIHLLKESNSHALIYQEYFNDVVDKIKTEIPNIKFIRRWSAEYPSSLAAEKYNVLLPLKSQTEELDATGYILHSSGSTSYPKLIPKSNKILHHNGNRLSLPENRSGLKDLVFYPLFHAAGHQEIFVPNIYYGKYTILPPDINPGSHYSTRMILSYIKELTPESLSLLPLIIKEIVEYCENAPHSEGWGILKSVKTIYHGGATLPELMSKALVEHQIVPHTTLGSTECGKYLKAYIDESQPDYTLLTPLNGVCYKLNSWGDDLVELVFLNSDPCLSLEKGLDEEGNFPTNDLYKIVGENPIQLKYVSRCDDTIVHVNGEKSNPIPMEEIINRCAFVDFSAVLGSGQQFNILLIQLKAEEVLKTPLSDVFASIMASVKLANESAPAHSRIYEEMIYYIPMKSEKNLPITMKGNLQRARCAKIFEKEVKSIVDKLDSGYNSDKSNESDEINSTGENLPSIVKSCLTSIIEKEIDTRQSFFNNGMDSLSGMRFRNLLKSKISGLELKVTDIYDNDTVEKLAEFIEFSKQGKKPNNKSLEDYQKEVDDYIARYANLGLEKTSTKQLPTEDFHIAITGANGSLGSFMIKNLVEQSNVSK